MNEDPLGKDRPLAGRTALVTGAASGLGREFCTALTSEGVRVAALDKDAAGLEALSLAVKAEALTVHPVDVTASDQVAEAVNAVISHHGRIDILINNVGIYPVVPFLETTDEFFDQVIAINLKSAYLVSREVLRYMVQATYGRIVNVATTGFYRPMPGHAHYAASKGGLIGLTRGIAAEFGDQGVTANCVAPGVVLTDTVRASFPPGRETELVRARAIPRSAVPDDIVGAVLFLASDRSSFITGQTIVVDGGRIMN